MKKKILALIAVVSVLFSVNTLFVNGAEADVVDYSDYMKKNMIKVYAHQIANNFYYGVDDEELLFSVICDTIDNKKFDINSSVKAMIERLDDEHSDFYTPEEYAQMTEGLSGEFSGIGVVINQNENGVFVLSVYENSPAEKGGIQEGDYITYVGGTSTEGMSTTEVRDLVVGETGTDVELTVRRHGEDINVVCTRAQINVKHTQTKMLTDDIGYIRITEFVTSLPDEVQAYLDELKKNKINKLCIDLRDNPGGEISAALSIANMFISAGEIGEMRYKDSSKNEKIYSNNKHAPKLKIAVLVNENSASASEFITMAFQSRKAAKIIGTHTYGKGSMQAINRIATGAGIKYTVGEFYSINGDRVHTIGLTPDIEVENDMIPVDESSFVKIDFDRVNEGTENTDMTLALEQRLNALGYLSEEPDEIFDENTMQAVKLFQTYIGYDNTGIPGFYEYMYLNDMSYEFSIEKDNQLEAATEYLKSLK